MFPRYGLQRDYFEGKKDFCFVFVFGGNNVELLLVLNRLKMKPFLKIELNTECDEAARSPL